jgi:hypothetical protein
MSQGWRRLLPAASPPAQRCPHTSGTQATQGVLAMNGTVSEAAGSSDTAADGQVS